jgi:hypothetical protein
MKEEYREVYGTWEVHTEGDVEGRTKKCLGTHTGYVDEIAMHLASKCTYTLSFKKVKLIENFEVKSKVVNITYDYNSDFTSNNDENMNEVITSFRDRPVMVEKGEYYNTFKLTLNGHQSQVNKNFETEKQDKTSRLNFGFGL